MSKLPPTVRKVTVTISTSDGQPDRHVTFTDVTSIAMDYDSEIVPVGALDNFMQRRPTGTGTIHVAGRIDQSTDRPA